MVLLALIKTPVLLACSCATVRATSKARTNSTGTAVIRSGSFLPAYIHTLESLPLPSQEFSNSTNDTILYSHGLDSGLSLGANLQLQAMYSTSMGGTSGQLISLPSEDEFKDAELASLMDNQKNTFHFASSKSTLYFDADEKEWYTRTFDAEDACPELKKVEKLIPVSSCMFASKSASASVQRDYSVQVSLTESLGGSIGLLNFTLYQNLGLSGTFDTSSSFSFTDSVSCTVTDATYAQMFIEPMYAEVPDYTRVRVKFKKGKGLVTVGSPEKRARFRTLVAIQPNHVCKYSRNPYELQCAGIKTDFILDF